MLSPGAVSLGKRGEGGGEESSQAPRPHTASVLLGLP